MHEVFIRAVTYSCRFPRVCLFWWHNNCEATWWIGITTHVSYAVLYWRNIRAFSRERREGGREKTLDSSMKGKRRKCFPFDIHPHINGKRGLWINSLRWILLKILYWIVIVCFLINNSWIVFALWKNYSIKTAETNIHLQKGNFRLASFSKWRGISVLQNLKAPSLVVLIPKMALFIMLFKSRITLQQSCSTLIFKSWYIRKIWDDDVNVVHVYLCIWVRFHVKLANISTWLLSRKYNA